MRKHLFNPKKDPPDKNNPDEYPALPTIPTNEKIVDVLKKASKSTKAEKIKNLDESNDNSSANGSSLLNALSILRSSGLCQELRTPCGERWTLGGSNRT